MRFAVTIALAILPPMFARAQQRVCEPARTPKDLPAVGALLDSAGAVTQLAEIDAPEGMLFSLVLLEGDSVPLVRPLFGTDSIAAGVLVRLVRAQQRGDESWAVRIRAAGGPSLVLRIERAVYCPPVLIPGSLGSGTVTVRVRTNSPDPRALRSASRRGPIGFRALVSEAGMLLRVDRMGSTGIPEVDEQIEEGWRTARFQPALLDGVAVQAWYRSDQPRPKPAELPPADNDSIYLESEVDELPEFLTRPPLRYPDEVRDAGIQGRVVVEAIIDKKGRAEPKSVRVIESAHPGLNEPSTTMVRQARFRPASLGGRAVRVLVRFPIDFTIED